MLSQIVQGLFRGVGLAGIFWAFLGSIGEPINTQLDAPSTDECIGCHTAIGDDWANHDHGQAATNEAFIDAWNEQGNLPICMTCHSTGYDASTLTWESPGVSCVTCHAPYNEDHPDEIMPTDVSTHVCGNCHLETFAQFIDSAHGKTGQNCYGCHNAHTTSLKTADSQDLCGACHKERVHSFELTVHASEGLLCSDCHLRPLDSVLGTGHGTRDHSFKVSLETCTECHSERLHTPAEALTADTENIEEVLTRSFPAEPALRAEPEQNNFTGMAVLGALFGMGFGIVVAPWLEKWYRRVRNKK